MFYPHFLFELKPVKESVVVYRLNASHTSGKNVAFPLRSRDDHWHQQLTPPSNNEQNDQPQHAMIRPKKLPLPASEHLSFAVKHPQHGQQHLPFAVKHPQHGQQHRPIEVAPAKIEPLSHEHSKLKGKTEETTWNLAREMNTLERDKALPTNIDALFAENDMLQSAVR